MAIDEYTVNVEFFGDHTQADIPLSQCFLYSTVFAQKKVKDSAYKIAFKVILIEKI